MKRKMMDITVEKEYPTSIVTPTDPIITPTPITAGAVKQRETSSSSSKGDSTGSSSSDGSSLSSSKKMRIRKKARQMILKNRKLSMNFKQEVTILALYEKMLNRRARHMIEDEYQISLHARGSGLSSISRKSSSFQPISREEVSKFVLKCLSTGQHMSLIQKAYTKEQIEKGKF